MNTDQVLGKIIFGHMHEDATTERDIVRYLACENELEHALVVCSGGETAASLLAEGIKKVDIIDTNETQLDICRLKIQICKDFEPEMAKMILTKECSLAHIMAIKDHKIKKFAELHARFFRRGICFAGKTDRILYTMNRYIRPFLLPDKTLSSRSLRFRILKLFIPLFARILHGNVLLPNGWTERILERLTTFLNEHRFKDALTQSLLKSRFPDEALFPWQIDSIKKICLNVETETRYINMDVIQHLRTTDSRYQLIALSNVCDLLDKHQRDILLKLAIQRLTTDGILIVRSMFLTSEDFSIADNTKTRNIAISSIFEQDRSILCPPVLIFKADSEGAPDFGVSEKFREHRVS